jgi:IS5 family transposase
MTPILQANSSDKQVAHEQRRGPFEATDPRISTPMIESNKRQRRLNEKTEAFRNRYRRRAGIEATMSRFKHQMGMARLRVRGMAKTSYVAFLRALGLNIHRVAAYYAALPTE